jgi:hypothetical protein
VRVLPLKYQGRLLCWWFLELGQAPICCENSRLWFSWHMSTFALDSQASIAFWCFWGSVLGTEGPGPNCNPAYLCSFKCLIPTWFWWLQIQTEFPRTGWFWGTLENYVLISLQSAFPAALLPTTKCGCLRFFTTTVLSTLMYGHISSLNAYVEKNHEAAIITISKLNK